MKIRLLIPLALAACGPTAPSPRPAVPPAAVPVPPPRSGAPLPPPASDAAATTPSPPAATPRKWLDTEGTSIVGFGVLRVVPPPGGGSFRIRYREKPTDYAATDRFQLFVLPGDCFAAKPNAFAGEFLAFARTPKEKADDYADLTAEFRAERETTVLVAYGPWTAPDTGRPSGDDPTFSLAVTSLDGKGAFEWTESEAGELITTNWTNRPEVARGKPTKDPETGGDLFVEVRPMILYDGRMVRDASAPPAAGGGPDGARPEGADAREQRADLADVERRADARIPMTRELAEKFRRVPIRWR